MQNDATREAIALALVNEKLRFFGLATVPGLEALEIHQYRDGLRYADVVLALLADRAGWRAKFEALRDSQGIPEGGRIEVDFRALIEVLALTPPLESGAR